MLIGSFSGGNYGDTIILQSLFEYIEQFEISTVYIPAANPQQTKKSLEKINSQIDVIYIDINMRRTWGYRFFNANIIKALGKVDIIAFTAGTIFFRDLLNPRRNFVFSIYLLLPFIKLFKVKLLGLFVGVNERVENLSFFKKLISKGFFNSFSQIITRDQESYNNISHNFKKVDLTNSYDIAFYSLLTKFNFASHLGLNSKSEIANKQFIGINICEYLGTQVGKEVEEKNLVEFLKIISHGFNSIMWFHTTNRDENFVIDELIKDVPILREKSIHLKLYEDISLEKRYYDLDFFVGMRMHSLIPALAFGIPAVALNYNNKVQDLFKQLGGANSVLDLDHINNYDNFEQIYLKRYLLSESIKTKIVNNVAAISI